MYLNGIVLISSILNFQTARFDVGNDLPYPLFLPTYTATAWYHKRLPPDLQARRARKGGGRGRALRPRRVHAGADAGQRPLRRSSGTTSPPRLARLTGLSRGLRRADQPAAGDPGASSRSCCATSGRRSAGSTAASRGSTATPPARSTSSIPATPPSRGRTPRCSTTTCAGSSDYKSDLPYEILTGPGPPLELRASTRTSYVNVAETCARP